MPGMGRAIKDDGEVLDAEVVDEPSLRLVEQVMAERNHDISG